MLTLSAPTPQDGQTRSINSSVTAEELFESVWRFFKVGAYFLSEKKRKSRLCKCIVVEIIKNNSVVLLGFIIHVNLFTYLRKKVSSQHLGYNEIVSALNYLDYTEKNHCERAQLLNYL